MVEFAGFEVSKRWPDWACGATDCLHACFDNRNRISFTAAANGDVWQDEVAQHGKYCRAVAAAYRSVKVLRKAREEVEDRGRIGGDTNLEVRHCERLGCWQPADINEAVAKTRALPGDILLEEKGETAEQIATHPHPFYTPIATFGSDYVMEPVAYGLKFAGQFCGASFFPGDFSSQLLMAGIDAAAYVAKLPSGRAAVIIVNKDADRAVTVSLDFGHGRAAEVETSELHAPALDSREASITRSPEAGHTRDGRYTVTVPRATGVCLII